MKYAIIVDAVMSGNALAYECITRGIKCIHLYSSINSYNINFNSLNTVFFETSLIYEYDKKLLTDISNLDIILCVAGSDFGVALADYISKLLNLAHKNTDNNIKFDRYLIQKSMGETCSDRDFNKFLSLHKKCIIKPKKSYGGYDRIRVVETDDFVTDSAGLYITPFYQGTEYCVDFVSCHGAHKIVSVWKYIKDSTNPIWRTKTELLDYADNQRIIDLIYNYMTHALNVIEYQNGATHSELIMTESGIRLVEINLRTHGHMDYIGTSIALSRNHSQLTIDALLGNQFTELGPTYKIAAHITRVNFFNTISRKFTDIKWDKIRSLNSHSTSYFHYTQYQTIPISDFNSRSIPAMIIFVNTDRDLLNRDIDSALQIFNE